MRYAHPIAPLLSLTGKRWVLRRERDGNGTPADNPRALVATIAWRRSIDLSTAEAPFDARGFRDFDAAVARLRQAIDRKEGIGIIGDYDCDGITSASILVRFFRRRGIEPAVRLPHRQNEGYGMKPKHVEEMRARGIGLLFTVDTGIASAEEVRLARDGGIDVIILDHHHVPARVPDAVAILHPRFSAFAEPHPSAAGVAWAFVEAMERADGREEWEDRATDLALGAIGTVADLVELRGGNRALVRLGVEALQSLDIGPLSLLRDQAGLGGRLTSRDIAFRIAPRINAAGRMDDPHIALRALLGDEESIRSLEQLNEQRQQSVASLLEDLQREGAGAGDAGDRLFLCIARADITPGVAGLIAGKLTETHGRPSLVASVQDDCCTASLRSVPGYHVTEALERVADLLTSYGGHAQAAGCTFALEHFAVLAERLSEDLGDTMDPSALLPLLDVDAALPLEQVTIGLCAALRELEPFGQGNLEPRFLIGNVSLESLRGVGRDAAHLQGRAAGRKLIGFGLGRLLPMIRGPVDLVCRLGIDEWNGRIGPQLFIDDIRATQLTPAPISLPSGTLR